MLVKLSKYKVWLHFKTLVTNGLRKPEATSMSRLTGFNKIQVGRFFDLLKCEISKLKVTSKQVFNVDESGITNVQVSGRILARKGSKQVGRVVSAKRGTTTTVVCTMSASGTYVPPMFIFKRKNMNNRLMNNYSWCYWSATTIRLD